MFYSDLYSYYLNSESEIIRLKVDCISKIFKGTNLGVQELSFNIYSGQLCAIMGGSGTGKTTLMNMMCGLEKPDKGQVLLNGTSIHENISTFKHFIGYVPQDDLLIEELSVYQNLKYALLLSKKNLTIQDINQRIDKTLSDLGLSKIKDLKVGSSLNKVISGGQRKRLNIALELIRNPELLFVDEPTSGLSSSDAYIVIKLLKDIANKGSIVIINIHQPPSDIFVLFDDLLILDDSGYAAYFGSPSTASGYFKKHLGFVDSINDDNLKYGNYNPEEVMNLMEYKERQDDGEFSKERILKNVDWHKLFQKETKYDNHLKEGKKEKDLSDEGVHIPGGWKQFWVYLRRNIDIRLSDYQYLTLAIGGAPLLALLMSFILKSTDIVTHQYSFIDNDNIPVYLFISSIVGLFLGLIVSSGEIFRDLKILKRESFLNLSRLSYLLSKSVYLSFLSALQMFLFVVIGNSVLDIKGLLWEYWLILWLTSLSSSMLGLLISSYFKSMLAIYITIPFLLIPQILLAGAILDYDKIHHSLTSKEYVPIYGDINLSRWSYEALVTLQFAENEYDKELLDLFIQKSEMTYFVNFVIPKIETNIGVLKLENDTALASELSFQIANLVETYPALENSFGKIKIHSSNSDKIVSLLSKSKKWLRANINQVNNSIDHYRNDMNKKLLKVDYRNNKLTDMVFKTKRIPKVYL